LKICFKISDYLLGANHQKYYNYFEILWLITRFLLNRFEKFWVSYKKFYYSYYNYDDVDAVLNSSIRLAY